MSSYTRTDAEFSSTQNTDLIEFDQEEKSHRLINDIHDSPQTRIVSQLQCNAMQRNMQLLLQENNADLHQSFGRHEFIIMFKKVLPVSSEAEIGKLFDLTEGKTTNNIKTLSFDGLLHNPHNLNKLLRSMNCELEDVDNDTYTDTDTDIEEEEEEEFEDEYDKDEVCALSVNTPHETRRKVSGAKSVRFTIEPLPENNAQMPQLSWMQTYRSIPEIPTSNSTYSRIPSLRSNATWKTIKQVNTNNYTEYMKYQKEQITELKNKISDMNSFEIRCNELQMILDKKHEIIRNLKEEIKQINLDKNEYIVDINNIKAQYNDLSQKLLEFDAYKTRQEMQTHSNHKMEETVLRLQNNENVQREKSANLKEEKAKMKQLNQQFAQINERLRDELQKRDMKMEKLAETILSKDEDNRKLTLNLLSKDQTISAMQEANEDLTAQLNYAYNSIAKATSIRSNDDESPAMDWGYGQSFYTAATENVEFDLFQELLIDSISTSNITPRCAPRKHAHTASTLSPVDVCQDVVINLKGSKNIRKDSEDEKAYEENAWNNVILLNRIRELEQEVEGYRDKEVEAVQTLLDEHSVATYDTNDMHDTMRRQEQKRDFWNGLFSMFCVPNILDSNMNNV